ncbi:hypothetical protein ACEPAF_5256 [Sanghuangporus sanghuang]
MTSSDIVKTSDSSVELEINEVPHSRVVFHADTGRAHDCQARGVDPRRVLVVEEIELSKRAKGYNDSDDKLNDSKADSKSDDFKDVDIHEHSLSFDASHLKPGTAFCANRLKHRSLRSKRN